MKRVLILTSSRADFGIYTPLLHELEASPLIKMSILAFGTHLSNFHGYTFNQITEAGFEVSHEIRSLLLGDSENDVATSYALTAMKFAEFWKDYSEEYDCVFVLGDRFEMAAAVASGIPFNINFAHLHGGETTLGAIDNIYRHSISLASKLHFVALPQFKERLSQLIGDQDNVFVTGSLSLDNLEKIDLLNKNEFFSKWGVDFHLPTILITVHPETVSVKKNAEYSLELKSALRYLVKDFQLLITMPNADTLGGLYRKAYADLYKESPEKIFLIENLGTQSYFSAMKHATLMLGNTSSGIIEAASFGKYVLNIGDRQKGRTAGTNVIDVKFQEKDILAAMATVGVRKYEGINIYEQGGAAAKIRKIIENYEF